MIIKLPNYIIKTSHRIIEKGLFTWTISYNGIGPVITVFSELAKVSLDLTDSDSW